MSRIDSCLKIAKLTAAADEMAPFPFIKGAALCVVVVLEAIEVYLYFFSIVSTKKNCRAPQRTDEICKNWPRVSSLRWL